MSGIHIALLSTGGGFNPITISDANLVSSTGGLALATSGYRLNSSGVAEQRQQAAYSSLGNWVTPTSLASNYEVRATFISGSVTGTFGTWLALSTSREWTTSATIGNVETGDFLVEIRAIAGGPVLDSATITLTADAS